MKKNWGKIKNLLYILCMKHITVYLHQLKWFVHYFPITMTTLYASPTSFTFH
jgi:hypothetical protein